MAQIVCCEHAISTSPLSYNAKPNGVPTEFICCGLVDCQEKQEKAAMLGDCVLCEKNVDSRWTLPLFAKNDNCDVEKGCPVGCTAHLEQQIMWLFCSRDCLSAFRKLIYGKTDQNLGSDITRVQICSQCGTEHINKPKLPLCGRCKTTRYCGKDCQRIHWSTHKRDCK